LSNPLLDFSGLPRFSDIRPEHVGPAIDQLIAEAREAMRVAETASATWDAFVRPLEVATERLSRAWGQIEHLHAVLDTPPLREAYNASLPKMTQFWTELGQNQRLFEKYRELKAQQADVYDFSESELNELGYALLRQKKIDEAIDIFRLNVDSFPQSANGYDSLAEAFMIRGDRDAAIVNYKKSLELDPRNSNAVENLKKLADQR
jgi:oligopeptidase A